MTAQYLKVSPRGFANEAIYLRVPADQVGAANTLFAGYEDKEPGRYAVWTSDKAATIPGVAVDWADRRQVLSMEFWGD